MEELSMAASWRAGRDDSILGIDLGTADAVLPCLCGHSVASAAIIYCLDNSVTELIYCHFHCKVKEISVS